MRIKEIFLIDDDADDTEIFLHAFESMGRDLLYSSSINPINALKQLRESDKYPDIIFLDINMPRMNGYEFLRSVKSTKGLKEVPVILISDPQKEFIIPHIRQYDKVGYMSKPVSFASLKSSLKQVLEITEKALS